jgi:MFS superfamily sulfate permease-like transporter
MNSVLVVDLGGRGIHSEPVTPQARTVPGLVVYRFTAGLYYANSVKLAEQIAEFVESAGKENLVWFCIDGSAMDDVDYSGWQVLDEARVLLGQHGIRLVFTNVLPLVRKEFDRYGFTKALGPDAVFDSVTDVVRSFERRRRSQQ